MTKYTYENIYDDYDNIKHTCFEIDIKQIYYCNMIMQYFHNQKVDLLLVSTYTLVPEIKFWENHNYKPTFDIALGNLYFKLMPLKVLGLYVQTNICKIHKQIDSEGITISTWLLI